jgi:ankyrin repeat protein
MELKLKVALFIGGYHGSVLHACAWEGKDEVARILLERGVDPNIQSRFSLLLRSLG